MVILQTKVIISLPELIQKLAQEKIFNQRHINLFNRKHKNTLRYKFRIN